MPRKAGPRKHNRASYVHGCRCDICKAAAAKYQRERTERLSKLEVKARQDGSEIEHGVNGYGNWGCRCETCTKAWSAHCRPATNRYYEAHSEEISRKQRVVQDETLERATRHYQWWTTAELEIASRSDLSVKDIALMLGRSSFAVKTMRQKIKTGQRTVPGQRSSGAMDAS